MSDDTKEAFYEILGQFYEKKGRLDSAAEAYAKGNNFESTAEIYEGLGEKEKARKAWIKAGDLRIKQAVKYDQMFYTNPAKEDYRKGGLSEKEANVRIGEGLRKGGVWVGNFIGFYEKANLDKSSKLEDLYKLAEVYEGSSQGRKAMKIRRKIERLKKKK